MKPSHDPLYLEFASMLIETISAMPPDWQRNLIANLIESGDADDALRVVSRANALGVKTSEAMLLSVYACKLVRERINH